MSEQIDITFGIERDPASDAFGEVIVPIIMLWSEPGGTDSDTGAMLTGALPHDTGVMVKEKKQIAGRWWCYVEGQTIMEEEIYLQQGWCRASLLQISGERYR